jgi:hypothetical protein
MSSLNVLQVIHDEAQDVEGDVPRVRLARIFYCSHRYEIGLFQQLGCDLVDERHSVSLLCAHHQMPAAIMPLQVKRSHVGMSDCSAVDIR